MTREEKKQAKLKLKQDIAAAKLNAKEMAEKVKTLTPDKVTLNNYDVWRYYIKNGPHQCCEYRQIKEGFGWTGLLMFIATMASGALAFMAFSFANLISLTIMIAVMGAVADSVGVFEIVKYAKKLNKIKADKTLATYRELKKQKLLGKLDEVFNEYAKTDKFKQEYAAYEDELLIANVESAKRWVKKEITVAEQQTRILPKLLKLLQENDAHSRYEIEKDATNKTATIKPAERGYSLNEVAGKVGDLIKNGVDIKFEK